MARLLSKDLYFDQAHALEAIQRRSSFNLLHLATAIKVNIFILNPTPFEQSAFAREHRIMLEEPKPPYSVAFSTDEDILLHKLRLGGRSSERQWGDILGILRVQKTLDLDYLRRWARELELLELLERALGQAPLD